MRKNSRLHFMGIAGSAISGAAKTAESLGYEISGCDTDGEVAKKLFPETEIFGVHDPAHIKDVDRVIYTPAIAWKDPANPELKEAERRGILVDWRNFMNELMAGKIFVGAAGTHGKSTTNGILGFLMERAGFDPSAIIGARVRAWNANWRVGNGPHFIIEADEFNDNFLKHTFNVLIITNVEYDHPEYFDSLEQMKGSFQKLVEKVPQGGTIIACGDDKGVQELITAVGDERVVQTYGLGVDNNWRIDAIQKQPGHTEFNLLHDGTDLGVFMLAIPGTHNVLNAVGAIVAAIQLGVDPDIVRQALSEFNGVGRRFEVLRTSPFVLIDDYGHHPTAIRETVKAAREFYPGKRVWLVYQPHQFKRTKVFFREFVEALTTADKVLLLDIYHAREKDDGLVSSKMLADAILEKGGDARYAESFADAERIIRKGVDAQAIVLVMGAGDIYRLSEVFEKRSKNYE